MYNTCNFDSNNLISVKQTDSSNFSRSKLISVFSTEYHFRRSFGEEQISHVAYFLPPYVEFSRMKSNSYFRVICWYLRDAP